MKRVIVMLSALCAILSLSACSSLRNEYSERNEQLIGVDKHSSYPAIRRSSFEQVNLVELIDPDRAEKLLKETDVDYGKQYDLAMAHFMQRKDLTAEEKALRRNSIQERILSVSISRCNVFKTYLRRDQSNKNFWMGSAATATAILGAILPGATAAKNLAGTAGIISGVQAEYNQSYFSSLAAHVIVKGIESKQTSIYHKIQKDGQEKSIDKYPLEAAIKDAIYFDGLCSVVVGLDQAGLSIDEISNPGIDAAFRTVLKTKLLREAVDTPSKDLLNMNKLKEFDQMSQQLGMQLVGTVRNDDGQDKDLVQGSVDLAAKVKEQSLHSVGQLKAAILKRLAENKSDTDKFNADANWNKEMQKRLLHAFSLETCYQKHAYKIDENRLNNEKDLLSAKNSDEKFQAELKQTLIKIEVNNQLKLFSFLGEKMQDKMKTHTASVIESLQKRKSNEFAAMLIDTQAELKLDPKAALNLSCKLD